ncbi:MAG: flagellar biosynthesis anti-sigma factor FlgM [Syntrophales bacterium LBB04]|nr:flagellar biosynthesis anti-sigma factor FlgM [Syntrophales bacterium LBB04]
MKISGNSDIKNEALSQYQQAGTAKPGLDKIGEGKGIPGDRISISSQTREINLAKGVIDKLPEIREDVVKDIKQAIDNGAYQVNLEKIAGKMVTESILDIYA